MQTIDSIETLVRLSINLIQKRKYSDGFFEFIYGDIILNPKFLQKPLLHTFEGVSVPYLKTKPVCNLHVVAQISSP